MQILIFMVAGVGKDIMVDMAAGVGRDIMVAITAAGEGKAIMVAIMAAGEGNMAGDANSVFELQCFWHILQ